MAIKTLDQFLAESAQKDASPDAFELESPRMLEIRCALSRHREEAPVACAGCFAGSSIRSDVLHDR